MNLLRRESPPLRHAVLSSAFVGQIDVGVPPAGLAIEIQLLYETTQPIREFLTARHG